MAVSTLEHVGGSSRSTRFRLTADSTGGKNNQQGWGSSQQYGMRYNMIALLNIVSEAPQDADNDGFAKADETLISKKQFDELVALAKDVKADVPKFCDVMGVEDLRHLPADRFEEAKAQLSSLHFYLDAYVMINGRVYRRDDTTFRDLGTPEEAFGAGSPLTGAVTTLASGRQR